MAEDKNTVPQTAAGTPKFTIEDLEKVWRNFVPAKVYKNPESPISTATEDAKQANYSVSDLPSLLLRSFKPDDCASLVDIINEGDPLWKSIAKSDTLGGKALLSNALGMFVDEYREHLCLLPRSAYAWILSYIKETPDAEQTAVIATARSWLETRYPNKEHNRMGRILFHREN